MIRNSMKIFLILIVILTFTGCSKEDLEVSKMERIAELNTLKINYNSVAKIHKDKSGALEKERDYWMQYTGTVYLGFNAKEMKIDTNDNNVKVVIGEPKITNSIYCQEAPIVYKNKDGWFNKNEITDAEKKKAMNQETKKVENSILENQEYHDLAKNNFERAMLNYINAVGKANNIEYNVKFKYTK